MAGKTKILEDKDIKNISPMILAANELLMEKALFENLRQDENNRTILGGVGFFFRERDGEYFLCWDKHPRYWNEEYMKEDIEEYKKYMLKQKGAYIQE